MENLNKKWQEFIQADTASFYDEFDCDLSSGAFSKYILLGISLDYTLKASAIL